MKDITALGFDFGMKRIGVAVGQGITGTATPLKTLQAKDGVPSWENVQKLIDEWQPNALVVGIPLNMDDTDQPITLAAKSFAKKLKNKFNLPVHLVDERLTTVEARQQIFEEGGYRSLQETEIDSVAAKLILEDWLQQQ